MIKKIRNLLIITFTNALLYLQNKLFQKYFTCGNIYVRIFKNIFYLCSLLHAQHFIYDKYVINSSRNKYFFLWKIVLMLKCITEHTS
jgi:hypothetical protein